MVFFAVPRLIICVNIQSLHLPRTQKMVPNADHGLWGCHVCKDPVAATDTDTWRDTWRIVQPKTHEHYDVLGWVIFTSHCT